MKNIDVHAQVVPALLSMSSEAWPSIGRRDGDEAAVMARENAFHTIGSRFWSVPRRLANMRDDSIDIQILSPIPELQFHWLPVEEADNLGAIVNERVANIIADNPKNFRGIGMVPTQDAELSAKRLEGIRRLGSLGIEIENHIAGIQGGDSQLDPVYAAAEEPSRV
jgi:aminocarboxymuconate-semialdehyde decarboxylase